MIGKAELCVCPGDLDILLIVSDESDKAFTEKFKRLGFTVMEVSARDIDDVTCDRWPKTVVGRSDVLLSCLDGGPSVIHRLRKRKCDSLAVLMSDTKVKISSEDAEELFIYAAVPAHNKGLVAQFVERAIRIVKHSHEQFNRVRAALAVSSSKIETPLYLPVDDLVGLA